MGVTAKSSKTERDPAPVLALGTRQSCSLRQAVPVLKLRPRDAERPAVANEISLGEAVTDARQAGGTTTAAATDGVLAEVGTGGSSMRQG